MNARMLAGAGAVLAFLAVALGAFGAHALRHRLSPEALATFETAVRYQMYHGLALILSGWAYDRWGAPQLAWAGWLFLAGILVFSGSLYGITLTGTRWLGAVTPLGGVAFLVGWLLFAWGALSGW